MAGGTLGFVYKAAAEIGELGDNTRALRRAIAADDLLRRSLQAPTAAAAVLGHTRWASVGIISQPNAHPLNSDELVDEAPRAGSPDRDRPYVTAVLNGDVDNFADLKATEALRIPTEITTDAKVIPTLVARELAAGHEPGRGLPPLRRSARGVGGHRGQRRRRPERPAPRAPRQRPGPLRRTGRRRVHRGVRALRPGRGDRLLPAPRRRDAGGPVQPERHAGPDRAAAGRGGRHPRGHRAAGLRRHPVAGGRWRAGHRPDHDPRHRPGRRPPLPAQGDHRGAGLVPQDAARQAARRRRAAAGRVGRRHAAPRPARRPRVRSRAPGDRRRPGHGGSGRARAWPPRSPRRWATARCACAASLATELSGFELVADLSDTLVVAISQSGTTTDTNRTVDLARSRGRGWCRSSTGATAI